MSGLIDFTSGLLTANVGHDNPRVRRAVARSRGWSAWYAPNRWRLEAYRALASILPPYLRTFLLFSTGSEAIDCALKVADDNGYEIVTDERSYHGSTIGAKWASGNRERMFSRTWMQPHRLGDLDNVKRAAVLLETFLGPWCLWYSRDLIDELCCRQAEGSAVVIFDEMQAGFGRTGRWFGFEHYDIKPDIVVGGKAAGGGFPVAFLAGRRELLERNPRADYVSTFSANPPACAALAATVAEIECKGLLRRVWMNEPIIVWAAERMVAGGLAWSFHGRGYAYAIDLIDIEATKAVVLAALRRGLLLLDTGRGTVKIAPPLCISEKDLQAGMAIIEQSIKEVREGRRG